ncbi:YndM family protein [Fictibacillus enclensis]|uniref:YndM family protein n=1 Tax=Fictibacillus enclensis TaxID=1017270 RepID=UPI0025A0EA3A|nr:YndM family protein [Fictibacillus enclensis]MDM5199814.1 YndM family protein [Fictibacillus enclensis]
MRHILRIVMKVIAAAVVLGVIDALGYDLGASDILGISAVLAIVSYVVGDLFLLRVTNNTVATIADFALAFVILYLMIDNMTIEDDVLSSSLIGSIAITAFEIFFHRLLGREPGKQASNQRQTMQTGRPQFQTEASSELTPVKRDVRSAQQDKSQENQDKQ